MPRLLILPVLAIALLAVARADDEEVVPDAAVTATASSSASATAESSTSAESTSPTSDTPTTTSEPTVTTFSTSNWVTYDGYFGEATFQYPSNWIHVPGGGIYSWDPDTAPNYYLPEDGIKVQASALPVTEVERPAGATDFTLGDKSGWELIEPLLPEFGSGFSHSVSIVHDGTVYHLIAYFGDPNADELVFFQILGTLRFEK